MKSLISFVFLFTGYLPSIYSRVLKNIGSLSSYDLISGVKRANKYPWESLCFVKSSTRSKIELFLTQFKRSAWSLNLFSMAYILFGGENL